MGKSNISMAIFNSYVSHYQRVLLLIQCWDLENPQAYGGNGESPSCRRLQHEFSMWTYFGHVRFPKTSIAIEHGPFIVDLPIKNGDFP